MDMGVVGDSPNFGTERVARKWLEEQKIFSLANQKQKDYTIKETERPSKVNLDFDDL